jgi:hypothetical protein
MRVCDKCYGVNVYYDAYVNVNDPTDVRAFSAAFCDDCGGETSLIAIDDDPEFLANALYIVIGFDDTGWVYWSNEDGWGDKPSATRFTLTEREAFTVLPDGSQGWVAVPR